jgi:hypothetical protein
VAANGKSGPMTERLREIYVDFRPRHRAVNFRVERSGTASMAVR